MKIYLAQFITIAILHLLALMSPGPDFIMVTRNSLGHSRKAGILTALGLSLGMVIHVAYSLLGLAYIIAQSVVVFNVIKVLGGLYLVYLGIKSLMAKPGEPIATEQNPEPASALSDIGAVRIGFLTNVLNPKVTLFFLAVFTQVISAETPLVIKVLYAAEMALATFLWFSFVAYMFSHNSVRSRIAKIQKYIDRTFGTILILSGLKVIVTK